MLWKKNLKESINEFIREHDNKPIIFVGYLDNFSNTIYKINADYKFILDVPLYEIMRRYCLRIYKIDQKLTRKQAGDCWKRLSKNIYRISSSNDIIKNYKLYTEWHKKIVSINPGKCDIFFLCRW